MVLRAPSHRHIYTWHDTATTTIAQLLAKAEQQTAKMPSSWQFRRCCHV